MKLVFDNMNDCVNSIPKGANVSVLYYGDNDRILLYGKILESDEESIKLELDSSEIKIIEILSIREITVLDKLKLAIDKDEDKYFKLEYKVFQDNEWKVRTQWCKDETKFKKELEFMSNNPNFEILNHD